MSTKPEDFAFSAALLLAKEMTENKRLRRELELVYNELNRALGQNAPKAWDRIAEACRVVSGVAVGVVRQSSTRDGNAASRESELVAEVEQLRAEVLKWQAEYDGVIHGAAQLRAALDVADWLITCERNFGKGKVVRGLGEARAGYESAREAVRG